MKALKENSELELSVKGRISGRLLPRPVWFVLSKDTKSIYLVPLSGRKTQWYLNVKKEPRVSIRVGGISFKGEAVELPSRMFEEVIEGFVVKYGRADIEKYYPRKDIDEVAFEVRLPSP